MDLPESPAPKVSNHLCPSDEWETFTKHEHFDFAILQPPVALQLCFDLGILRLFWGNLSTYFTPHNKSTQCMQIFEYFRGFCHGPLLLPNKVKPADELVRDIRVQSAWKVTVRKVKGTLQVADLKVEPVPQERSQVLG